MVFILRKMCRYRNVFNLVGISISMWIFIYMLAKPSDLKFTFDEPKKQLIDIKNANDSEILEFLTGQKNEDPNNDDTGTNDDDQELMLPCDDENCPEDPEYQPLPPAPTGKDYGIFDPEKPIRILSWTQLWGKKLGPWFPEGTVAFDECSNLEPEMKCTYTHDKTYYNVSDAVLFHSFHIKDVPDKRINGQKWVFWEYESPRIVNILQNLQKYKYMFNITSTYDMTSDVPLPFLRKCVPQEGERNVRGKKMENYAAGKDRMIAWFVSHCQTPSRRENYVKALQEHVAVDIYGKCGPFKCDVSNRSMCYKDVLEKRYKFYLAFENSLCKDYVTEKLWDVFDHRLKIIPIVLGASDYASMLPEGTYIDIRDYKSPMHLAVYLKYLDRHPDKYNEYIRRRNFDWCNYLTHYKKYQCGLCEHLWKYRGTQQIALNVATMWGLRRKCVTPRSYYEGIAPDVVSQDSKPIIWEL